MVLAISCKKNEEEEKLSSYSFKANNTNYSWNFSMSEIADHGAMFVKTVSNVGFNPQYLLNSWNKVKNLTLYFVLNTPTLNAGTFKKVTTASTLYFESGFTFNGIQYFPLAVDDYIEVTITSISDNHADGTFKAVMHDMAAPSSRLEITNGSFNHILISN